MILNWKLPKKSAVLKAMSWDHFMPHGFNNRELQATCKMEIAVIDTLTLFFYRENNEKQR